MQQRQFLLHDVPQDPQVQSEVVVNELVSEPGHLRPFDVRMFLSELRRQALRGFADDFEVADDCVLLFRVDEKIVEAERSDVALDSLNGFPDVFQRGGGAALRHRRRCP